MELFSHHDANMPRFGLVGPSYESQSPNLDAQKTVNWYPEVDESGAGNSPIALLPTPGTKSFVDLTPPAVGGGIQNIMVSITAAQLKASGSVPIPLIPAQGPNLVIVALSAVVNYLFVSQPYSPGNGDLNPVLGIGTSVADILNSFTVPLNTNSFWSAFNTIQTSTALSSWSNLPPAKFVNLPLQWVDQNDVSGTLGDGTMVINIQYYVLNIVTGQIVNGTGKVHAAKVDLTTAQIKNAFATPVQLIPATGANQVIVPISAIVWYHFNTTAFNQTALPKFGYGTVAANVLTSQIFQFVDSNSLLLAGDSVTQIDTEYNPFTVTTLPPGNVVNQPLSWVNFSDIHTSAGDTTATVYIQYMVIDVTTGAYIQGSGTLFNQLSTLTAAQIKAAFTSGITIVPAPGVNKLIVERHCTAVYTPATAPFGVGDQPAPRIAPAPTAAKAVLRGLLRLSTNGAGITLWTTNSAQMQLESTTFYVPPDATPGDEVPPADVVNQPSTWGDFNNTAAGVGDGTCEFNLQYMVLDTSTGALS